MDRKSHNLDNGLLNKILDWRKRGGEIIPEGPSPLFGRVKRKGGRNTFGLVRFC